MGEESLQEKTEPATAKHREESRKKGQVAKSAEMSSFFVLSFSLLGLLVFGPAMADTLSKLAVHNFQNLGHIDVSITTLPGLMSGWMITFLEAATFPAMIAAIVGTSLAVLQVGWKPSFESMEFKWDRFDVIKGVGKLVSGRSLFQLVRDSMKLALIGWIAYYAIRAEQEVFPLFVDFSVGQISQELVSMSLRVGFKVTAGLLIIAALDYAYQKWEHEKKLRMTKQQLKEESKHLEGDPHIKARVRKIQREMAQSRMMQDAAEADVVVTNPTHLAVALKYDRDVMGAPKVVAKGADYIASKIRDIAKEHGVPVVEDKPLAQALYRTVRIGVEIPEALFEAAAAVLALAYGKLEEDRS